MTRQVSFWRALSFVGMMLLAACDDKRAPGAALGQSWENVCVDRDGDGFGFQCGLGSDCDDDDPKVHDSCSDCRKPGQGCACEEGATPVDCRLPYSVDSSGALLCHTGTRYCRDGAWSGCEGVVTYSVPPPLHTLGTRSLVDPAASHPICDECNPDCHQIKDRLNTPFEADAGIGTNVVSTAQGGVTLVSDRPLPFTGLLDDAPCAANDKDDCDGLPIPYDADPTHAPGGTSHKTMFLEVPLNGSAAQAFKAKLAVDSVDVYLYQDATPSMEQAIGKLASSLGAGNFFPGNGDSIDCLDKNGDGQPDNALKDGGIAGNLSCLIRDVRFGTGWFREIPFYGPLDATGEYVAPWDMELFEHRVDMSADIAPVQDVLATLGTRANSNTPEGSMQGLWSLATGAGQYVGWNRPGVLPRTGCPASTFGYPCFRDEALQVLLTISDAPMEEGPPVAGECLSDPLMLPKGDLCEPLHYDDALLSALEGNSEGAYKTLSAAAENFATAEPVAAIDGKLVTYLFDTRTMRSDIHFSDFTSSFACGAWKGSADDSPDAVLRFEVTTPGNYLISARGSRYDATLVLARDNGAAPPSAVVCQDDTVTLHEEKELNKTPEIEGMLSPGIYYVIVKGYVTADRGWTQISIGQREAQTSGKFDAKRWLGPQDDGVGGIAAALQSKAIRAATIQPGTDSYARNQAIAMATRTKATSGDVPLRGATLTDGTYIGEEIVRVVSEVVRGTRFDVSLDLAQTPDDPVPDFALLVEAIKQPGNGCRNVLDVDGDPAHTPDTHLDCLPSATPQFRVTFSNPSNAVPPNTADPTGQGGYRMWMRVLGDKKVVLDRVPVYVRPTASAPVPFTFAANGFYEQEVRANACSESEGPVWGALGWAASLPPDTHIRFEACAAETEDALPNCTFHEAFTLSPGGPCQSVDDCGGVGYCDSSGVCHIIQGASCMQDTDCGAFGTCSSQAGLQSCTNTRALSDLYPVAHADMQGRRYARIRARLVSSADRTQVPTLLEWSLNYTCAPRE